MGTLLRRTALILAVFAAMLATAPASPAEPAPAEPGVIIVVEATDEAAAVMGADCGGLLPPNPCGIVNNRTSGSLEAARDSKSHTGCDLWPDSSSHPRKVVPAGRNSNQSPESFKDTDCFRSIKCGVFYLGWHDPGEWVRIWSSVYIYSINC